jgi:pimeloyl-ACP methyl ester carboxylesterase
MVDSTTATRTSSVIDIDGFDVFYEAQGDGMPLVLLHGGMAGNDTWSAQFDGLSPFRRVLAPERQAHGHTPDRDGPLTYQLMAEQTIRFLEAVDGDVFDLVGWSDGGMVGLLVASERPALVRSLALTGTGFSSAGYVPGALESFIALPAADPEMAMYAAMYAAVSPRQP